MRVLLLPVLLTGCSAAPKNTPAISDIYHRSTEATTGLPSQAAACIAKNAERADYAADVRSLYGSEVMAVTVRTLAAGGTDLATLQLTRAGTGSRALVTTTLPDTERTTLVSSLIKGC